MLLIRYCCRQSSFTPLTTNQRIRFDSRLQIQTVHKPTQTNSFSTSSRLLLRKAPKNPTVKIFGVPLFFLSWPTHFLRALVRKKWGPIGDPVSNKKTTFRLAGLYFLIAWTALGVFWITNSKIERADDGFGLNEIGADRFVKSFKDMSEIKDPTQVKKYVWTDKGIVEDHEFTVKLEKQWKDAKEAARDSDDVVVRRKWGLLATKEDQQKFEEYRAAKAAEKERLLEKLREENESRE